MLTLADFKYRKIFGHALLVLGKNGKIRLLFLNLTFREFHPKIEPFKRKEISHVPLFSYLSATNRTVS